MSKYKVDICRIQTSRLQVLSSAEMTELLQAYHRAPNDELKEKLFVEIKTQLEEYMSTPAYVKLLEKQIKDILKVAGGEHVTIYIDPNDQFLLQDLAAATNTAISVSEYSFMGGTRAVLEERHMLIDNSFETKLTEAKEQFTFSGGVSHE